MTSGGRSLGPTGKPPSTTDYRGTCTPCGNGRGLPCVPGAPLPREAVGSGHRHRPTVREDAEGCGEIYPEERDYFNQTIEPLLHQSRSWVEFLGEVGGREKDELLGNALALLFPIDWPEPFGLVMIEAMACGTPVIAWRHGSVPEVMEDDVTGFVVDSVEEAVFAVGRVASLCRRACRAVFEERYDAVRMARDYLEVYRRLAHAGPELVWPAPHVPGPLSLPVEHSLAQRKPCRLHVPLLGTLPGVNSHTVEADSMDADSVQMLTGK